MYLKALKRTSSLETRKLAFSRLPQDWHTLCGQAYGKTVNRGLAFQVHSIKAVLRDPSDGSVECPLHTLSRPASFQEAHGGDVRSQCPGSDPGVVSEPLACVTLEQSFTSLPGLPFFISKTQAATMSPAALALPLARCETLVS